MIPPKDMPYAIGRATAQSFPEDKSELGGISKKPVNIVCLVAKIAPARHQPPGSLSSEHELARPSSQCNRAFQHSRPNLYSVMSNSSGTIHWNFEPSVRSKIHSKYIIFR